MAKIQEQIIVIRLSKLIKGADNGPEVELTPEGFAETVEALVGELVGDAAVVVEVETVDPESDEPTFR